MPYLWQLAEFKVHKAACNTPHDDRSSQALLKVTCLSKCVPCHSSKSTAPKQVVGAQFHELSRADKLAFGKLYSLHSRSANLTVEEAIDRLRVSGDRLEAALKTVTVSQMTAAKQ